MSDDLIFLIGVIVLIVSAGILISTAFVIIISTPGWRLKSVLHRTENSTVGRVPDSNSGSSGSGGNDNPTYRREDRPE